MKILIELFEFGKNRLSFLVVGLLLFFLSANFGLAYGCTLFGATGNVTADSITIIAKDRDLYWRCEQRIWHSQRANHSQDDTIHFRHISIPQCSLTYKFIATNSIVEDQTTGYGINEYGLAVISHDMDSWDDDSLGTEYFHDQDYVALALARCKNALEAIYLFNDLILPHGINAEAYLIVDANGLWLLETTGYNWVAKLIADDVVSSRHRRYTIGTDWNDEGNLYNADILTNAENHGCTTDPLNFSVCFSDSGYPPYNYDPDLLALKDRGDIIVEDMRILVRDNAGGGTVSACVIPIRPDKNPAYFSFMWDSRANPKYGNVFLPYWIAINDSALPEHYTTWPPDDPDCAWNMFSEIAGDSTLRAIAEPIWQVLQAELYAEFDTVEAKMQTYLDANDTLGLQEYINSYVYGELDSAYELAKNIIASAGVPQSVDDLSVTLVEENLRLDWSSVTVDTNGGPLEADLYRVYRDTVAFFDPGSEPFDSTVAFFYVDNSGVVGDTGKHYYYVVTAVAGDKESGISNMVGEFDRGLMVEE
jgi:dipeptidase